MRRPEIPKVLIFSQGSLPLILLLPHPQPPKHTLTRPSWFMAQLLTKGEEGAATVWADLRAKLSSPPPLGGGGGEGAKSAIESLLLLSGRRKKTEEDRGYAREVITEGAHLR